MTADWALVQHRCETAARRLEQLRHLSRAALAQITTMLDWWEEARTWPHDDAVRVAVEKTEAALVAVTIDLESTLFAMESAQLRASATARLVATSTMRHGADYEKQ